jgi:outer membrane lipoprotein
MIMNIRICILIVALFLVGCATFPDKLQLKDTTKLIIYEDAASKGELFRGQMLRWGGAIAKVDNKVDSTIFEMVHYPLNSRGRPISDDDSAGRFRISFNGFMDPMVYQVGRLMTFTAKLDGSDIGLVGEYEYVFPTASVIDYHLWKKAQRNENRGMNTWPNQFWYGGPWQNWHNPHFFRRNVFFHGTNLNVNRSGNLSRSSGANNFSKPVNTQKAKN